MRIILYATKGAGGTKVVCLIFFAGLRLPDSAIEQLTQPPHGRLGLFVARHFFFFFGKPAKMMGSSRDPGLFT